VSAGARPERLRTSSRQRPQTPPPLPTAEARPVPLALSSLRTEGVNRDYYQKKRNAGRTHKQALVALARRRVDVLWALIRDHRTYTAQPPPRTLAAA